MEGTRCYYVYILASKRNGTLYVGVTNDLLRRVAEHKEGKCTFTKRYGITRLVYYDATRYVMNALESEKRIKKWERRWKIELIEERNPQWKDLFDALPGPPRSRG